MSIYNETFESAAVSFSTSGDNTVIAAPTSSGQYIAIDFLQFIPASDVTITLKSGSTALTGAMPFKANQANTVENAVQNEHGILTCADQAAFVMNTNSGVAVTGIVRYRIINK